MQRKPRGSGRALNSQPAGLLFLPLNHRLTLWLNLWEAGYTSTGKKLPLCLLREGKEQQGRQQSARHRSPGSGGLFTNTIPFQSPESGTVDKVPPGTHGCLRGAQQAAWSGHVAATPTPDTHTLQKAAPCVAPAAEERDNR